jgi:molybdopterin synthase sulfur carrier subunit
VLFFASVRERLGVGEIAPPVSLADTDALRHWLAEQGGTAWREVLEQPNLICAVNQEVVHGNCRLRAGDEVAFYPPVTGG